MNSAQDENPAALRGQRFHYRFDLAQRLTRVQLSLDIAVTLKQLKVGDRFKADNLVPASVIDHQIASDGEQVRTPCRHILPILRGIGASHDLCDHVVQFQG